MSNTLLLIPHIQIQNANALSSPFTIGFPAVTAWLGAVHALQRALNATGLTVRFDGVGIISHQFNLHTYKGRGDFEYSIIGTANPIDKDGERPSFIEEPRCHLEVSLVIECTDKIVDESHLLNQVNQCLNSQMKIAGGDILGFKPPRFFTDFKLMQKHLMPGYALIERRDLMIESMNQGQDALDAILDYLCVHHQCDIQEHNGEQQAQWSSSRKTTGANGEHGWIVPIATGFQGLSDLAQAEHQRDPEVPHCFAESIVTLGEFKMVYKLSYLSDLLWHYHFNSESQLYLCQQTIDVHGF